VQAGTEQLECRDRRSIRREQFRQARAIHGGLVNMLGTLLAIKLSRVPIPSRRLRLSVYRGAFAKKYPPGLDEFEAELPLWAYPSFNALFTRGIKPRCRPIATDNGQYLGPCDGTIQEIGRVENGRIITLKKIEYTLTSLVPGVNVAQFEGGNYSVIFLSPVDCHRVYCPQDGTLEQVTHVPGHRLLVHPPYQRSQYPVYTLNERMILGLSTPMGPCLLTMIAGWGVGNITLPLLPHFKPRSARMQSQRWENPPEVHRGQWLATFELGSTVVLITPPAEGVVPLVGANTKVKYGQSLFGYRR
jgi:phosphatidylserine decarboxylase